MLKVEPAASLNSRYTHDIEIMHFRRIEQLVDRFKRKWPVGKIAMQENDMTMTSRNTLAVGTAMFILFFFIKSTLQLVSDWENHDLLVTSKEYILLIVSVFLAAYCCGKNMEADWTGRKTDLDKKWQKMWPQNIFAGFKWNNFVIFLGALLRFIEQKPIFPWTRLKLSGKGPRLHLMNFFCGGRLLRFVVGMVCITFVAEVGEKRNDILH